MLSVQKIVEIDLCIEFKHEYIIILINHGCIIVIFIVITKKKYYCSKVIYSTSKFLHFKCIFIQTNGLDSFSFYLKHSAMLF